MNLFDVLNRGAAYAPPPPRYTPAQLRAINGTRLQWLNALLVDQTRTWMSLGEHAPEVLEGMDIPLLREHAARMEDMPEFSEIYQEFVHPA